MPAKKPKWMHFSEWDNRTSSLHVRLTNRQIEKLTSAAFKEDRTINNLVGRILKEWLDNDDKKDDV